VCTVAWLGENGQGHFVDGESEEGEEEGVGEGRRGVKGMGWTCTVWDGRMDGLDGQDCWDR
jgi:hypothetical protein